MEIARRSVSSPSRLARLVAKFRDKSYRDSYVRSHTKQFLARQMRAFRGEKSQKEFAELIGVTQSMVSERLENPNYGKWTSQTLFDTASKLNVAVFVRFVDFETFLKLTANMSEDTAHPLEYDQDALDAMVSRDDYINSLIKTYTESNTESKKDENTTPVTETRPAVLAVA